MNKEQLRKKFLALRTTQRADGDDEHINTSLLHSPFFQNARSIMFYYAKGTEVSLHSAMEYALANGKKVILPKILEDYLHLFEIRNLTTDLCKGTFGVMEPAENYPSQQKNIDLIFVPGVVFDLTGGRIGYGKGFYDRFLKDLSIPTVGIAYDFQVIPSIPLESTDVRVRYIQTEQRLITCYNGNTA